MIDPDKFVKIVYLTSSDNKGRCTFELYWRTDYIPGLPYPGNYTRGQVFFANPEEHGYLKPEDAGFNNLPTHLPPPKRRRYYRRKKI